MVAPACGSLARCCDAGWAKRRQPRSTWERRRNCSDWPGGTPPRPRLPRSGLLVPGCTEYKNLLRTSCGEFPHAGSRDDGRSHWPWHQDCLPLHHDPATGQNEALNAVATSSPGISQSDRWLEACVQGFVSFLEPTLFLSSEWQLTSALILVCIQWSRTPPINAKFLGLLSLRADIRSLLAGSLATVTNTQSTSTDGESPGLPKVVAHTTLQNTASPANMPEEDLFSRPWNVGR